MAEKHPGLARTRVAERKPAATIARSIAPAVATAPMQRLGNAVSHAVVAQRAPTGLQAMDAVSSPHDRAEGEAVQIARTVVSMPAPARIAPPTRTGGARVQRAPATASPPPVAAVRGPAVGGGAPLPASVRGFMEPRFGADFSQVRIHTDAPAAERSAALGARAFTVGQHVFFGQGQYQPDSGAGRELIAHELTHTIQQGAAIQRSTAPPVQARTPPTVQRSPLDNARNWFADKANYIPGFRLLTIVIGLNPITMAAVDRSVANLLRALLELIPVTGKLVGDALENHGLFAKVGAWIEVQVRALGLVGSALLGALEAFLKSLGPLDAFNPSGVWDRAKRIFTDPIDRLFNLAKSIVVQVLVFIRDAILLPLAKLAEGTRGYDLLKAVLGKDPITGAVVVRTPDLLIGGFMKFIGQEEVWENIKKANALPRAWAWFQGAMNGLMGFVSQLPDLFVTTLKSLEIIDLVLVPKAFAKVAGVFGGFAAQFLKWAGEAVWNLLEIIFAVVAPSVLPYLKKTGEALRDILRNPLPFVRNLVRAAKQGFMNFGANLATHLKNGLIDWLTGSLPGIYIPKAFSLVEIVKFVLSVLGLTWANIRGKLVKVMGETAVKALETGFAIVAKLVTEGPAAAWELIKEQLANLKDMVIGGITDFVVDMVVQKAIPKLIAMFIPGAGFISAIVSIYETVMVFVDKLAKIAQVVKAFVDSIVAIAGGAIDAAAKRVETTLAGLLSLAISFLAGFAGLGKVADKVMGVIAKVRAPIDKAIDWLIAWIVKTAKVVAAKLFGKDKKDERTDAQKQADLAKAGAEAQKAMTAKDATPQSVQKAFPGIKKTYRLTSIALVPVNEKEGTYKVSVKINPEANLPPVTFEKMDEPTYQVTWGVDAKGRTVSCKATLTEVHKGAKRSSAEKTAQRTTGKSGKAGDQGGHIIGHRFIGERGVVNMFPQNARFNTSDWKIMENRWADEIGLGHSVDTEIAFTDFTGVRPDTIVATWSSTDPVTKQPKVPPTTHRFKNIAHQK